MCRLRALQVLLCLVLGAKLPAWIQGNTIPQGFPLSWELSVCIQIRHFWKDVPLPPPLSIIPSQADISGKAGKSQRNSYLVGYLWEHVCPAPEGLLGEAPTSMGIDATSANGDAGLVSLLTLRQAGGCLGPLRAILLQVPWLNKPHIPRSQCGSSVSELAFSNTSCSYYMYWLKPGFSSGVCHFVLCNLDELSKVYFLYFLICDMGRK